MSKDLSDIDHIFFKSQIISLKYLWLLNPVILLFVFLHNLKLLYYCFVFTGFVLLYPESIQKRYEEIRKNKLKFLESQCQSGTEQMKQFAGSILLGAACYIKPIETMRLSLPILLFLAKHQQLQMYCKILLFGFVNVMLCITAASWVINDFQFSYLYNSYLRQQTQFNLRPNIGLMWYFFTEMFERYRDFFVLSFATLRFVILAPLFEHISSLQIFEFREKFYWIFIFSFNINTLLNPHPTLLDYTLSLILLLPLFIKHYDPEKQQIVLIPIILISLGFATTVVMWWLWVQRFSGNANFLYFQSVVLNMGFIYLFIILLKITKKIGHKEQRINQ